MPTRNSKTAPVEYLRVKNRALRDAGLKNLTSIPVILGLNDALLEAVQ
jgi:hypothetical protein